MAFDAYHKWLGIPPKEQPPHHYRLLGLGLYESDPEVIDAAANRQMAYVQSCASGQHLEQSQVLLNELSAARLCLLTPQRKQQYDALLQKAEDVKVLKAEPIFAQDHAFSSNANPSNHVHRNRGSGSLAAKLVLTLFIALGGVLGLFVGKSILDRMHPPAEQAIAPGKMEIVVKDSFGRIIPSENSRDLPSPPSPTSSSAAIHATRRTLPVRPLLLPTGAAKETSVATITRPLMPAATATPDSSTLPAEAMTKTPTDPETPKATTTANMAVPGTTENTASVDDGVQSKTTARSLTDELASLQLSLSSQAQPPGALTLLAEQALRLAGQASSAKDEGNAKRFVLLAFQAGQRAADGEIKSRAIKRLMLFGHSVPQTVSVVAQQAEWQPAGVMKQGDIVVINSRGTWSHNSGGGSECQSDGDGTGIPGNDECPIPGAPLGALIGRIGTHRFVVGALSAFEIINDGVLDLINNDNTIREDNAGTLVVHIIRIPMDGVSSTGTLPVLQPTATDHRPAVTPSDGMSPATPSAKPTVATAADAKQAMANRARLKPTFRLANVESLNWLDHYLTPENSEFRLTTIRPQSLLRVHFNKFAPDTVAFESAIRPGWYLVEFNDEIGFLQFENNKGFKQHASFALSKPFGTEEPAYHSFESTVAKGRYIIHVNFKFYVRSLEQEESTSATFRFKFVDR